MDNEFVNNYIEARREFIRSLNRSDEKGIMARIDKVQAIAIRAVEDNDTLSVAKTYHIDDEIEVDAKVSMTEPDGSVKIPKEVSKRLAHLESSVEMIQNVLQEVLPALKKEEAS